MGSTGFPKYLAGWLRYKRKTRLDDKDDFTSADQNERHKKCFQVVDIYIEFFSLSLSFLCFLRNLHFISDTNSYVTYSNTFLFTYNLSGMTSDYWDTTLFILKHCQAWSRWLLQITLSVCPCEWRLARRRSSEHFFPIYYLNKASMYESKRRRQFWVTGGGGQAVHDARFNPPGRKFRSSRC